MPTPSQSRKRGRVVRIRTKRLPDGTLLRVHVMSKKGPRGGRAVAEKVKPTPGKGTHRGTVSRRK